MRPLFSYVEEQEDASDERLTCGVCHDVALTHRACPQCKATFCKVRRPAMQRGTRSL
jgi:hypothetical protein